MTNTTTGSVGNSRTVPERSDCQLLRKQILRFVCIAGVLLVAWCVAWGAARLLIVSAALAQADALVVMSGSSSYVERTNWAAQLWSTSRAPLIILTNDGQRGGWSSAEQRNPFFVERAIAELERAGVPSDRIVVLPQVVGSTHDEAIVIRQYVETHKLKSILLVTSAYHSRRALWTMETEFGGSGVRIGIETPPPGQQSPSPATWWLHTSGWKGVAGEYVKLLYYYARFR